MIILQGNSRFYVFPISLVLQFTKLNVFSFGQFQLQNFFKISAFLMDFFVNQYPIILYDFFKKPSWLCNRWVRYTGTCKKIPFFSFPHDCFVPSLVKICPLALEVQAYNPAVALFFFLVNFTSNIFIYIPNLFQNLVCRKCRKYLYKGLHFFFKKKKKPVSVYYKTTF